MAHREEPSNLVESETNLDESSSNECPLCWLLDYNGNGSVSGWEYALGVAEGIVYGIDIITIPSGEALAFSAVIRAGGKAVLKTTVKASYKTVDKKQLAKWGVKDVHKFKSNALGTNKNLSKFDVVKNTKTHELMIMVRKTKTVIMGTGKFVK